MNHLFQTPITTRPRRDSRREDLCDNFPRAVLREKQRRIGSMSVQKKSPKKSLIKINKKRFPKDFFPEAPVVIDLAASPRKQGNDTTRESYCEQTVDTPSPSSGLINFEEEDIFNRTSFFGGDQSVSQTIELRKDVRYYSEEKSSVSKGKPRGKLTAIPSMHKSNSHNIHQDDIHNCTFSRDFSSGLQNVIRSNLQLQKERDNSRERQKERQYDSVHGKMQNQKGRKWSELFNVELFPEGETMVFNEENSGNFRMRKKILIASRPTSLLPKICS